MKDTIRYFGIYQKRFFFRTAHVDPFYRRLHFRRDPRDRRNGPLMAFRTRKDAEAWIKKQDGSPYWCDSNEYARPDMRVRMIPKRDVDRYGVWMA
jgi:hypothetical protein